MRLREVVYTQGNYLPKVLNVRPLSEDTDVRVSKYDLVYIFMWATPFGSSFFERLYRLLSRRIVYDIEDNIFMEQSSVLNPFVKMLKGTGKASYLIKTADHVITSSPFLNDYCLGINSLKACTYISSSVDSNRFIPTNTYNNKKAVTIGWTGTFSSKIYLDLLRDVFLELNERTDFVTRDWQLNMICRY